MRRIFNIRADILFLSALLIGFYIILIAGDIYTTWLGTPDLKMEMNFIIRYFQMNYTQIIIFASIWAVLVSIGFLKSLSVINDYKINSLYDAPNSLKGIFKSRKLSLSFLGIWIFTTHFITSAYLVVNNYFGYLYIANLKNQFYSIAFNYLVFKNKFDPHFFKYVLVLLTITAFFITWLSIRRPFAKQVPGVLV